MLGNEPYRAPGLDEAIDINVSAACGPALTEQYQQQGAVSPQPWAAFPLYTGRPQLMRATHR